MASDKNKFPHPFTKIVSDYRNFRRKATTEISNIAANEFKENFRKQGYEDEKGSFHKWKKRKKGEANKKTRGVLIKSGRLKRSIRPAATYDYARVVTDVPYAQKHNEGFSGTEQVKKHTRRGKKDKKHTVKSYSRKVNMAARPFMITSKSLLDKSENYVFNELETIFKNA